MDYKEYKQKYILPNSSMTLVQNVGNEYISTLFANCPFPVKKIKFKFAYILETSAPGFYLVQCDLLPQICIGTLGTFSYVDSITNDVWYQDGFKETTSVSYEFKDPLILNTTINFQFTTPLVFDLVTGQVAVLIECFA